MVSRLVLGCGSVGRSLVASIADRPGRTLVLCRDDHRIETLRSDGVAAQLADPTDRTVLANVGRAIDVIVVAGDDAGRNVAAARAAREAYPDAFVLAYAGEAPTVAAHEGLADLGAHGALDDRGARATLRDLADRVIDPGTAVAEHVTDRIGGGSLRPRRLWRLLGALDGPLAVVTHDNPDPDAIASASALGHLAEAAGREADACYFGNITHQENRALVNLLDIDLTRLNSPEDLAEYGAIALVDHSRPGVNDQLPGDTIVDVVIDHHPPRAPVEARFVDLRSDVGATSTLLVEYLDRLDVSVPERLAMALLYGIRIDTDDFSREVSAMDFEAAAFLLPAADSDTLERVETSTVGAETLGTVASAIRNRRVEDAILLSCVENLGQRDALAQAADQLLALESVHTTLVYGIIENTVYLSGRTRGTGTDLGEVLRDAFDRIGSAGGHADMAGAQLPLGLLGEADDAEAASLNDIVSGVVENRFLEALRADRVVDRGAMSIAEAASDSLDATERASDQPTGGRFEAERDDADDPAKGS